MLLLLNAQGKKGLMLDLVDTSKVRMISTLCEDSILVLDFRITELVLAPK